MTLSVVTAPPGVVEPAAEVNHRSLRMFPQILSDLIREVILPHRDLEKAEALHRATSFFREAGKIVVNLVDQTDRRLVTEQGRNSSEHIFRA